MWLAAIAALVVGGPLGACMFIAAGITHYLKIRKVDAEYAAKGEMPPSAKLIDKWLEGRKARGKAPADAKPAKYGMWRYFWQRWQAMWEVLAEGHKIRHQQYLEQCRQAAKTGAPKPPRPSFKEQAQAGWQWVVDTIGLPLGNLRPRKPAAASTVPAVAPRTTSDGPVIACDECGATLADAQGGWQHPDGSGCPKAAGNAVKAAPAAPAADKQEPSSPPSDQKELPPASASGTDKKTTRTIDPNDGNTNPKGTDMTAPTTSKASSEVVGLTGAINYAAAVAQAHEAHSTGGGEQYRAALGMAQVGPETMQSAAAAQEASEIAGAMWRAHEAKLKEQLAAKEATTAETGKKDFLLAD